MTAAADLAELHRTVHGQVLADLPVGGAGRVLIDGLVADAAPLLAVSRRMEVVDSVLAALGGLGPLEDLLVDQGVTELMVNGPGAVWVERAGQIERTDVQLDRPAIERIIERIVAPLGLRIDRASPVVDARLADGSRVHAVLPPLAVDGPYLTIRRFGAATLPLEAFAAPVVARALAWAVRTRANFLVSGGTGSGKTTLLGALTAHVPSGERIVTIEDAAELRLPQAHVVRLEARTASAEGAGEVRIRDLVRHALRMRPDRIVVGECRGPEALDVLQAMNTGHEGSLSTLHANTPADALRRVETMVLMGDVALPLTAVREQVGSAVDFVVQVARRGADRRITEVAEVVPSQEVGGPVGLRLLATGERLVDRPTRSVRGVR